MHTLSHSTATDGKSRMSHLFCLNTGKAWNSEQSVSLSKVAVQEKQKQNLKLQARNKEVLEFSFMLHYWKEMINVFTGCGISNDVRGAEVC